MNQFHKDYKISILRVCEKVEELARRAIQLGIYQETDFFPYLTNLRREIMNITTDDGFQSYYGNWGAREIDTLIKQVCGSVCVCQNNSTCHIAVNECNNCPIFCYRETYGSDEEG